MAIRQGFARAFAITPSDTVNFTQPCEAIYVGGAAAGDIVVVMADNTVVTFDLVPIGTILPLRAKRVNATGTVGTAELIGLWGQ